MALTSTSRFLQVPVAAMIGWMKRVILLFCVLFASTLSADSSGYRVEQVAEGLGTPWGLAFLNDSEMLITEREGDAKILSLRSGRLTPLSGLPRVYARGQGGLLDVAVPSGYQGQGWIYFTYSKPVEGGAATTLARAQLRGNSLVQWEDLLVTRSVTDTGVHFGSRIAFDDQGHLFLTIGDRGKRPNGQDLGNHAASILRLHRDGTIPATNPFWGEQGALPEIWSYGHRNPQGIAFDSQQRLWAIEHGPRGGDEINLIEPGNNYGWPVISYGMEYWGPVAVGEGTHKAGMEQPVKIYTPSIAPGSLLVYSGKAFPEWRGNLFAGALKLRHINRITLNRRGEAIDEERLLESLGQRIRALVESSEGWIYFSTDSGNIYRLRP